jgi:hypothetical protein
MACTFGDIKRLSLPTMTSSILEVATREESLTVTATPDLTRTPAGIYFNASADLLDTRKNFFTEIVELVAVSFTHDATIFFGQQNYNSTSNNYRDDNTATALHLIYLFRKSRR